MVAVEIVGMVTALWVVVIIALLVVVVAAREVGVVMETARKMVVIIDRIVYHLVAVSPFHTTSALLRSQKENCRRQLQRNVNSSSTSSSSPTSSCFRIEIVDEIRFLPLQEIVVDIPRDVARRRKRIDENIAADHQERGAVCPDGD